MAYGTINVDSVVNSNGTITGGLYGFKNRIINGAMMIDQRNAGASVTPTASAYTLDRWQAELNVASKFSVQQSTTVPSGFVNSLVATSASSYSVGAGEYFYLSQNIEGFNVSDLGWGAVGASTVTLSFWVRSSLTGTFGGALRNNAGDRSYPFTYTISSANTWTQISVTVAGDTSGTWLKNNSIGIRVSFGLGVGSTFSGSAGSWAGANYASATGATSVVGTSGATFYITGVQLEKNTSATSFDYRPYGTELALCQRYYQIVGQGSGGAYSTTNAELNLFFPVSMRTSPSFTLVSGTNALIQSGTTTASVTSIDSVNEVPATYQSCRIVVTSSGLTATRPAMISKANFAGASAEL